MDVYVCVRELERGRRGFVTLQGQEQQQEQLNVRERGEVRGEQERGVTER